MQLKMTDQKALAVAWFSFQVWSKVFTLHVRHRMTSKTEKHKKAQEASYVPLFLLQISNQSQPAAYIQSGLMKPQFPAGPLAAHKKGMVSNNAGVKGTFNSMLSLLKNELRFL